MNAMKDGEYRPSFKSISQITPDANCKPGVIKISDDPRFRRRRTDLPRSRSTDCRNRDERHPQFVKIGRSESTPPSSTSTLKHKFPAHLKDPDNHFLKLPPRPPPRCPRDYEKPFQSDIRPKYSSGKFHNDSKMSSLIHVPCSHEEKCSSVHIACAREDQCSPAHIALGFDDKSSSEDLDVKSNFSTTTTIGSSGTQSQRTEDIKAELRHIEARNTENFVKMQRNLIQRNEQLMAERSQIFQKQKEKKAPAPKLKIETQTKPIEKEELKEKVETDTKPLQNKETKVKEETKEKEETKPCIKPLDKHAIRHIKACKSPSDTVLNSTKKLKIRHMFKDPTGIWTCRYRRNYYFLHGKLEMKGRYDLCPYCVHKSTYYARAMKPKTVFERVGPQAWRYSLLAIFSIFTIIFISTLFWVLTNETIWSYISAPLWPEIEYTSIMYSVLHYFDESGRWIWNSAAEIVGWAVALLLLPDIGNYW